jgi:hypothetical protein
MIHLQMLILADSRNSAPFMVPEVSATLSYSEHPAIGPLPERGESSSHTNAVFL